MHAIVYAATRGFLFQTMVSAVTARNNCDNSVGVFVVYFGSVNGSEYIAASGAAQMFNIDLLVQDPGLLDGFSGHVARFFIDDVLPENVQKVVYLDGDTLVTRSLVPLLTAPLRKGCVGAALDPMVLREAIMDKRLRRDQSLEAPDPYRRYFNSGVLTMQLSDMPEIRSGILKTLRLYPTLQFHDQDALNMAFPNRIQQISMSWNCPAFLIGTRAIGAIVDPAVLHFMSNPRPWNGILPPWGPSAFRPYAEMEAHFPELRTGKSRFSTAKLLRYRLQYWFKRLGPDRLYNSQQALDLTLKMEEDAGRKSG